MTIGAVTDIRSRQIPNLLSLVTVIAGLGFAFYQAGSSALLWHGASTMVALVIGMFLFGLKMWGGGDGKFFAASAAWFPLSLMFSLILAISLAGLALALIWMARSGLSKRGNGKAKLPAVPYGVAIGIGAVATALLALSDQPIPFAL